MKTKILTLLIALLMVAGIAAGCGGESSGDTTSPSNAASSSPSEGDGQAQASSAPNVEALPTTTIEAPAGASEEMPSKAASGIVRLITPDQSDKRWITIDSGSQNALMALEDMGGEVDYKWLAPDAADDAQQIEKINEAITEQANVIMIAPNSDAVSEKLGEAAAAGIKVVYIETGASFEAEQKQATDNLAAGEVAGQEVLKELQTIGFAEGKIGIIGINAESDISSKRVEGFKAAFEGSGFELLEPQYANGDEAQAQSAAAQMLADGAVAVFGCDAAAAAGVGNAIKEAGDNKIVGVGFETSEAIKQLILDGNLNCTLVQNLDKMGYDAMITAGKLLAGDALEEKEVDTGVLTVNKGNVDFF